MNGAPEKSLVQWAGEHGRVTTADVDSHIHAGLRSVPPTKTYRRWFDQKLRELQDARDATEADYRAAVERGEVRDPKKADPIERLKRTAQGHGAAAEAAKRLLAKKGVTA